MVKVRHVTRGRHVHAAFFIGADADHLQHSGELVLYADEWRILEQGLDLAARVSGLISFGGRVGSFT